MKNHRLNGVDGLDLISMYLFWGGSYVAVKVFVEYIPPIVGTSLRYFIAFTILAASLAVYRDRIELPNRREVAGAALTGALFLGLGTGLLTLAAPHIEASLAALIFATVPAFLAVFEFAFAKSFNKRLVLAGLLGILGVAILFADGLLHAREESTLGGMSLALAAALSWTTASYFFGSIPKPSSTRWSLLIQTLVAWSFLAVVSLAAGQWSGNDLAEVPLSGWEALLFAAVLGSIVAYGSFQRLLRRQPPEVASTYTFVNPIVATLAAAVVLGEKPSALRLAAGASIVGVACYLAIKGSGSTDAGGGQNR